ncbi:MAG: hypothetical protein COA57_15800 [Flavobacteriales bacterium]|nr:YdeI/OmpD-associated family protein [Bacteroidales bacterium AH-315-I05]PCJ79227.1 MAG: hypothetical protein COA57_15800 [Flavobacteriales bacterium]
MNNSKTVEEYISNNRKWQKALTLLQEIILSTKLEETVKWGGPVYTFENKNVVGIAGFKSYVGMWFFQGVLLKDEHKKLINAQEGVTKALRQWRFSSAEEIHKEIEIIKEYLIEAISNQAQGKEIKPVKNKTLTVPEELLKLLSSDSNLKNCFESFSLSKRREFSDYISEAKRMETKQKRLEKIRSLVLNGEGLHDKYRN